MVALLGAVGKPEEGSGSGRNCSAERRGQGIGIRGSYESESRRDTGNNCSSSGNGVGGAFWSSEVALSLPVGRGGQDTHGRILS